LKTPTNEKTMALHRAHCTLLASFVAVASGTAVAAIPPTERTTLLALYAATDGANWYHNDGWNSAVAGTECSWYGVTCASSGTNVTFLQMSNNNLAGVLPSLDGLTQLGGFNAANSHLSGTLPALDQLSKLEIFDVNRNQLTGSIPSLAGLSLLYDFEVWNNQLSGPIPPLDSLTSLGSFYAFNNQLSGPIPTLAGLVSLSEFHVYKNQLTGTIPSLTGLVALNEFEVQDNQLTGSIPDLAGVPLTVFRVGGNRLDGNLPSAPAALQPGASSLCVNAFPSASYVDDAGWDAATGTVPWYSPCNAVYANGFEAP
jgi:Leucine rich repeat N-terminal domain